VYRIAVFVGFARFKLKELAANPAHLARMWKRNHDEIPSVNRIAQTYCLRFRFRCQCLPSMQCVLQFVPLLSMVAITFYFSQPSRNRLAGGRVVGLLQWPSSRTDALGLIEPVLIWQFHQNPHRRHEPMIELLSATVVVQPIFGLRPLRTEFQSDSVVNFGASGSQIAVPGCQFNF
jgi:hypothetical protein